MLILSILSAVLAGGFALMWWLCCKRVDAALRSIHDLTPADLDF